MTDWDASNLTSAIAGLRDRAEELKDYPDRLHVAGVQPRDLLGAPKLSPAFWRWLTGSVHATHAVLEERACPLPYSPSCPRCDGLGSYPVSRDVYTRPLARALAKLAHARSGMRPHPSEVIDALIRESFSVERAAMRWGVIIMTADQRKTEEARILSAIRALRSRYEETVLGPGWLSRSDSQRAAEDAARVTRCFRASARPTRLTSSMPGMVRMANTTG